MNVRKMLVAVDYSPCSKNAVEYALFLAAKFGARVDLVHAWDRPYYAREHEIVLGKDSENPKTLTQVLEETALDEMKAFLATIDVPEGVEVHHRVCSGHVATVVIELAGKEGYDVLVTGTHGRTGFKHMLLGSVAERLVRLSPVPVMTVPPPASEKAS